MIMCLFSVYQPIHVNFFLCVVFNFRSCRPSWQPRNCLRDWRSLWGATLLTVAPRLPTERFTMKEPSSPQRKTDPGKARAGETSVTLALRETGFGPRNQDPSNRIFTPRTRILKGGKGSFTVWRHSWYPRLSSGNWMAGWETSSLNCHSVRIGFSCFSVLQE